MFTADLQGRRGQSERVATGAGRRLRLQPEGGPGTITDTGTIRKTAGTGSAAASNLVNNGTLEVNAGSVTAQAGVAAPRAQTGRFDLAAGTSLHLTNGAYTFAAGTNLPGLGMLQVSNILHVQVPLTVANVELLSGYVATAASSSLRRPPAAHRRPGRRKPRHHHPKRRLARLAPLDHGRRRLDSVAAPSFSSAAWAPRLAEQRRARELRQRHLHRQPSADSSGLSPTPECSCSTATSASSPADLPCSIQNTGTIRKVGGNTHRRTR